MGMKKLISVFTALAAVVFVSGVGVALADIVYNDLDASIDATLETMDLTFPGPTGSTSMRVNATIGDGKPGCNLTGSTMLVVDVNSSDTSIATVSPSTLTFSSCGDVLPVTVTPVGIGSAIVYLSLVSNTTAGTFNLLPALFRVNVAEPVPVDTTAPEISVVTTPSANGAGWNNSDVTVIWTVNDPESAISSMSGCDTVILTDETAGTTLTCTATSAGGTSSQSVTIKIDETAPVVTITTPADGGSYTYNQIYLADWSATDALSSIDTAIGTTASGVAISTTPIGAQSYMVTATDVAGNSTMVTNNYTVVGYDFNRCYPPLTLYSKDFKKASTIPVKCSIIDTLGRPISTAMMQLYVDDVAAVPSGTSNYLNYFRYSPLNAFYIYNLSTKMPVLTIGTHTLKITADDGSEHLYAIKIK